MEQLNLFSFFQDLKVGFYHKKPKGLKIPQFWENCMAQLDHLQTLLTQTNSNQTPIIFVNPTIRDLWNHRRNWAINLGGPKKNSAPYDLNLVSQQVFSWITTSQQRPHFATFCPHFAPYFPNFAPFLHCAYELNYVLVFLFSSSQTNRSIFLNLCV